MPVLTNTDQVDSSDRQIVGPKPDDSHPDGGESATGVIGIPPGGLKFSRLAKDSNADYVASWHRFSVIDAMDYGVTGDGSTDDTAAVGAALDAAIAAGAAVQFPPGAIKCTSAIAKTVTGAIAIIGCGEKVTRFTFPNATDGLAFDLSTGTRTNNAVKLRDCGIISANAGNGTALKLSYGTTTMGSVEDRLLSSLENVEVRGTAWVNGFDLINCWHFYGRNLYAYGSASSYDSGSGGGSGFGIRFSSGVNNMVSGLTLEFFNHGLEFTTAYANGGCQGILVDAFLAVEVNRCLYANAAAADVLDAIQITNFLFDNGNLAVANHASVWIKNAFSLLLSGGQILQNSGTQQAYFESCTGVFVDSVDFSFSTGCTQSIQFAGTSSDCRVSRPKFGGVLNALIGASCTTITIDEVNTNGVTDNGSGNFIYSQYQGCGAQLEKTSTQSIADTVSTAVSWDSAAYDDASMFSGGSPTRLTVPSGVRRVRLTGNVNWDSNSTGYRSIQINKNGAGSVAGQMTLANLNSQGSVTSAILSVTGGDYFELFVEQNSGAGLDVENSTESNFSMEVIR